MKSFFYIRTACLDVKVYFSDILYIKKQKQYVEVVTETKTYVLQVPLRKLSRKLPSRKFGRVHRRYMVPLKRINAVDLQQGHLFLHCTANMHAPGLPGIVIPISEPFYSQWQSKQLLKGREMCGTPGLPALLLDALLKKNN